MTFSESLKLQCTDLHQQVDTGVMRLLKKEPASLKLKLGQWYQEMSDAGVLGELSFLASCDLDFESISASLGTNFINFEAKKNLQSVFAQGLFGTYYVIRGSANGSSFLIKHLSKDHPLQPYFRYMGSLPVANWLSFKQLLDQTKKMHQPVVIQQAQQSFSSLLSIIQS